MALDVPSDQGRVFVVFLTERNSAKNQRRESLVPVPVPCPHTMAAQRRLAKELADFKKNPLEVTESACQVGASNVIHR